MSTVPIRVLGGVRLHAPAGPLRAGGPVAERLLGVLVAAGGAPVALDLLVEALWPQDVPDDPVPPLRMAVSRLRRRLAEAGVGGDTVAAGNRTYRLDVDRQLVDTDRFTDLVTGARTLAATAPDRAAAALAAALALWRGEPFGHLNGESWARGPAARLAELRADAEEQLADLDLARGREALAVPRLQAAAESEPLRERRWAQLATALYRLGRQAEALRALDTARTVLREELGLDPGEELRRLERAVLDHDAALLAPATGPHAVEPVGLVGRGADVREVLRLLDANRVVTVVGLGGVGKSALVRAVTARLVGLGRWVNVAALDGVSGHDAVWGSVAAAVGIGGAGDVDDLRAAVAARLRQRPAVLVLDGAEAGAAAAADVADLVVATVPGARVLATSRVALGAGAEVRYLLDPLAVDGDGIAPAVQLFLDRAGIPPDRLDEAALGTVRELCERSGGLPLAIELAAASVDRLGLAGLRAAAAPSRNAVDDSVGWALAVVPDRSRSLLGRLALLRDGASLAVAARLAGSPEDATRAHLGPLVQARLLDVVGHGAGGVRYRPLEPIREAAAAALDPADAASADAAIHELLVELGRDVADVCHPTRVAGLAAFEAEIGNVRDRLAATVGTESGLVLAVAAAPALGELGLGGEAARWLRDHRRGAPGADPLLQARAVVAAASTTGFFVGAPVAVADLEAAVVAADAAGDVRLWLFATYHLATAVGWGGDVFRAFGLLVDPRTVDRQHELADPWVDAYRARLAAVGLSSNERFGEARSLLDGIPDRFLDLDDPSGAMQTWYVRAWLARADGDLVGAADDLALAGELTATGAARATQALLGTEHAHLARSRGERTAPALLALAIDDLERAGNLTHAAAHRRDLAAWCIEDDDVEGGLTELRTALPTLLRGDRRGAAVALAGIADAVADRRPADARRLAGAALSLVESTPGPLAPEQRKLVDGVAAELGATPKPLGDERILDLAGR